MSKSIWRREEKAESRKPQYDRLKALYPRIQRVSSVLMPTYHRPLCRIQTRTTPQQYPPPHSTRTKPSATLSKKKVSAFNLQPLSNIFRSPIRHFLSVHLETLSSFQKSQRKNCHAIFLLLNTENNLNDYLIKVR